MNKRTVCRYLLALSGAVASLSLFAGCTEPADLDVDAQGTPEQLRVVVTGERVSVNAHGVSLERLLTEIASQSGLTLAMHETADRRVSVELSDVPLSQALSHILQGQNFALQYVPPAVGDDAPTVARRTRLWVFAYPGSAADQPLLESTPGRADRGHDADGESRAQQADDALASLRLALADGDTDARLEVVTAINRVGGETAATTLAGALLDESAEVRAAAVDSLGAIGGGTAISVLQQAVVDPDDGVREAAIDALAEIGGSDAVSALAVALNDEVASVREDAVDALGEIGGDAAILMLQQALADENPSVRAAASEVLAELTGAAP